MRDDMSTRHSDLRVMQRMREFDKTMTELWEEGIDCEVKYHGYDEARVLPEYDVVMLKQDGKIITVLQDTYNVSVEGQDLEQYLGSALEENDD